MWLQFQDSSKLSIKAGSFTLPANKTQNCADQLGTGAGISWWYPRTKANGQCSLLPAISLANGSAPRKRGGPCAGAQETSAIAMSRPQAALQACLESLATRYLPIRPKKGRASRCPSAPAHRCSIVLGFIAFCAMPVSAGAEVIRFNALNEDAAATEMSVLRYDRAGRLIKSEPKAVPSTDLSEDELRNELLASGSALVEPSGPAGRFTGVMPGIDRTAARYQHHPALRASGLSPQRWSALFKAMIWQESRFNPAARSPKGAMGLTQLMPGTAAMLGVDARDPMQNLDGGARYLLTQLEAFGSPMLALAAYNAGPQAVKKYGGVPPYRETRDYVIRVLSEHERILLKNQ